MAAIVPDSPFLVQDDTMAKFFLQKNFMLQEYEDTVFRFPPHSHDHFELILIQKGTGIHFLNDSPVPYKANDIFFISPNDYHFFSITDFSSFLYLKFSEQMLDINYLKECDRIRCDDILSLLHNPNIIPGDLGFTNTDRNKMLLLFKIIKDEYFINSSGNVFSLNIIHYILNLMIFIVARSLFLLKSDLDLVPDNKNTVVQNVLNFIRANVGCPDRMNANVIANNLNLSVSYVRRVFRQKTGKTLMQCVWDYRILLAENLLIQSQLSIGEICLKVGFVDQSHFNKQFRKKFGMTPGEYRLSGIRGVTYNYEFSENS